MCDVKTKKEAFEIAKSIKDNTASYNNPTDEASCYLYEFVRNDTKFNVFISVGRQRDDDEKKHKYYSVYYGVEFDGGDNLFADYAFTDNLRMTELADIIFDIANRYKQEEYLLDIDKLSLSA